jgi:putative PIN family toxin of toxin-antitoxin system
VRIVLDTNALVSGLLNPFGPPGRILDLVTTGDIVLQYDDRILSEYRAVLARDRFGFEVRDVKAFLTYVERHGEPVVARKVAVRLQDPDDRPFLEVAIAGSADVLVTGTVRHFHSRGGQYRVKVQTPGRFLRSL